MSVLFLISTALYGAKISQSECATKGEKYIFAGGECIEFFKANGDRKNSLNIIVHGTWKEGTNTLARYAPFAENIALQTDITTIAIALPGYAGSSTNNFQALSHDGVENLAANKAYIDFLGELVSALKNRYKATTVTYIGHSAGAMMGATLTGLKPNLIDNIVCAGGRYDIHEVSQNNALISVVDVLDNVSKDTHFILVYGTKDEVSEPKITKAFYEMALKKGLDVKLVEVPDAPHLDLDMSDESVDAIVELLDN